jgi:hypothetical protein
VARADGWRVAAAFVVTLFVVLALGALVSLAPTAGQPQAGEERMNVSSFDPARNLVDRPAERGRIRIDANTSGGQRILIDAAHSNQEVRERTQVLVDALTARGHDVRLYGPSAASSASLERALRGADAFVVVAPTTEYSPEENRSLDRFTDRGGRLLLVGEPTKVRVGLVATTTTRTQLSPLTTEYNASLDEAYLFDQETNTTNFRTVFGRPTGDDSLTAGVDRVAFYEASPLTVADGTQAVLRTPDSTRLSSTRRAAAYTVAARTENVTIVGDASFMTPANYRTYDNEVFVGNLAEFLLGGERADPPAPEPTTGDDTLPVENGMTTAGNGTATPGNGTTPPGNETETPGDEPVPAG